MVQTLSLPRRDSRRQVAQLTLDLGRLGFSVTVRNRRIEIPGESHPSRPSVTTPQPAFFNRDTRACLSTERLLIWTSLRPATVCYHRHGVKQIVIDLGPPPPVLPAMRCDIESHNISA